MRDRFLRLLPSASAILLFVLLVPAAAIAYVGRCPTCGTVDRVDPIAYARDPAKVAPATGAILGSIEGRAGGAAAKALPGRAVGRKSDVPGERGTRLEIRMDKGGVRTIDVHGDPRIYRGDRVRVFRDRVELL